MSLYKYITPISKCDCLKSADVVQKLSMRFQSIRFSPPNAFNDPFELLPDTTIVETQKFFELLKRHYISEIKAKQSNLNDMEIERLALQRVNEDSSMRKQRALTALLLIRPARILCLSKIAPDNPKALLLWAHYTANHAGMVLEFDDAHPWIQWHANKQGEPHDYKEVQYRKERAGWNGLEPADEFQYTKSEGWIYEDEVRLIRFVGDKDFDTSTVDSLVKFPSEMILSVTLGVNNAQEKQVREALDANRELANVNLYKAELHPDEFRLNRRKLPR